MKKIILLSVFFISLTFYAQNGFNYKAIVSENGQILSNHTVKVQVYFYEYGTLMYEEEHETDTDENGIFRIFLGEGVPVFGYFTDLDWSQPHTYRIYLSTDGGANYYDMGEEPVKTVPVAHYAEEAGNAFSGDFNDLFNVPAGLDDGDDVDDADHDPNNEIQTLTKSGNTVSLSLGGGSFTDEVDDADHDPNNELQTLSLNGNQLSISFGNTVTLPSGSGAQELNDLSDAKANGMAYFIGEDAGYNNSGTYSKNIGMGYQALYTNALGDENVAVGFKSLYSNDGAHFNTAIGSFSLYSNTSGLNNTAAGADALYNNTTGNKNTATGCYALRNNVSGDENTAMGYASLSGNTTGINNTVMGAYALTENETGNGNTVMGYKALYLNTTGSQNIGMGLHSLYENTEGGSNVAIGTSALLMNTTGSYNTAIGTDAFTSGSDYNNSTAIGYNAQATASNQVRIGNSNVVSIGGYANWTTLSDGHFKKDIRENVPGMVLIEKLRPVTYRLDMEALAKWQHIPAKKRAYQAEQAKATEWQIGFIAQEVEQAANEVGFDFHAVDKPKNQQDAYGLRYSEFVPVLVKALQEQQDAIQALQNENQILKTKNNELEQRLHDLEQLIHKN